MYQRHFGITGRPFQLSPDPHFFFDSGSHRIALAALRQAFDSSQPFVLLSGGIGTGKTTVLHTWIAETRAGGAAVAKLTNTQLDADELMQSIATAFGVPPGKQGLAHERLRDFLRGLDGRAALLVIDEAQNLGRDALRRLGGLADTAAEEGALLRICLAGQPELRMHLADPTLHEVQPRIGQACHLGPLSPSQTGQYIVHRLSKVGWSGIPAFDPGAFEEIHRLTGGVPRRINVLTDRLFLSLFLSGSERIDPGTVVSTAHAVHAEISEGAVDDEAPGMVFEPGEREAIPVGALLVVVSGRSDQIKAAPLLRAIDGRGGLPPAVGIAVSDDTPWRLDRDLHAFLGLVHRPVPLVDDVPAMLEDVGVRFGQLIGKCRPEAVIVFDRDPLVYHCASIAYEQGVPVVHVASDDQLAHEHADSRSARAAMAALADLCFESQSVAGDDAAESGGRSFAVGNLLADAVHLALQMSEEEGGPSRALDDPSARAWTENVRGYGVVALREPVTQDIWSRPVDIVAVLRDVCRDVPLVWPMRRTTMLEMRVSGLMRTLTGERIACIEELAHASFVRLLRQATCVLTDCPDVMEEAAMLGLPCLSLGVPHAACVGAGGWLPCVDVGCSVTKATRAVWDAMFNGPIIVDLPALWDGNAAQRIAVRLAHWHGQRRRQPHPRVPDMVQPPG